MSNRVTKVQLHTGFFIPGVKNGNMKAHLPPDHASFQNLVMTRLEDGSVQLEWDEGGFQHSYIVNAANVIGCALPPKKKEALKAEIKK